MNRILPASLLVLLIAGTLMGQTTGDSSTGCNLAREKAPVIRGIKLGMTSDELYKSIPGIRDDYKAVVERAKNFPEYGAVLLSATPGDRDQTKRFEGIEGYNFRLFDDRVVEYSVYYKGPNSNPRGPTWPRPDDFIAKFAESFHLPGPANWIPDQGSKLLKCQGFEVRINTLNNAYAVVFVPGNAWVSEQKKRREAFEEQLRRDFKP